MNFLSNIKTLTCQQLQLRFLTNLLSLAYKSTCNLLSLKEEDGGIFCGAAVAVAVRLDSGERYLTSLLFEGLV